MTSVRQGDFVAPIGADAENIPLFEDEDYVGSLKDFYDNWVDFKRNNNFSYTGSYEPNIPQVKVWYQTYPTYEDENEG